MQLFYLFVLFNCILPMQNSQKLVGGCAGTRYGCCPDTNIYKRNMAGTNCNEQ